jgi:diadenosine tetraphosphate (Ap4A) HIT family hydrolase
MTVGCIACDLTEGRRALPGGRIHATACWVVEHCVGPLGVGTLLVKPFRHCVAVADLTTVEAAELGPLLHEVSRCVHELNRADQVYVCLWSHAGWEPAHIHFVIQPAWRGQSKIHSLPGPAMQSEMFRENEFPDPERTVEFCDRARQWMAPARDRTRSQR